MTIALDYISIDSSDQSGQDYSTDLQRTREGSESGGACSLLKRREKSAWHAEMWEKVGMEQVGIRWLPKANRRLRNKRGPF